MSQGQKNFRTGFRAYLSVPVLTGHHHTIPALTEDQSSTSTPIVPGVVTSHQHFFARPHFGNNAGNNGQTNNATVTQGIEYVKGISFCYIAIPSW